MRSLLSAIIILTLLSSCGVKRPLELPCHSKRHKADDGNAQSSAQQPDNKPCPEQQVDANGQILAPAPTPTAPVQGASGQK